MHACMLQCCCKSTRERGPAPNNSIGVRANAMRYPQQYRVPRRFRPGTCKLFFDTQTQCMTRLCTVEQTGSQIGDMMDSRGTHPAPWPSVESRADINQASDKNAASATQQASMQVPLPTRHPPAAAKLHPSSGSHTPGIAPHPSLDTVQVIAASALFSSAFEKELATNAEIRNASRALGELAPVDLPSVFAPDKAYPLLLQAYGFSAYLMAPERGVRRLVADALQLYRGPITDAAASVLAALLAAAEMAAATALPEAEWPDHVRLRVLDESQACIRAWHSKALAQLEGLLAAECLCPEQEAFAGLRARLQQRLEVEVQQALKEKSKAAVSGAPGRTQPDPAAETETETEAEAEAEYFMGSLDKLDRHGRWRRRWFVYQASDRVLSYGRSPKSQQTRTFVLQGGAVVPRGGLGWV